MTTAFLQITDAVLASLQAAPALAGGRITRGRATAVSAAAQTAIAVNVARSRAEPLALDGTSLQWETTVVITLFGRAAAGSDAEAAIDPLLVSTWARLQSLTPPAGVVDVALDPTIAWDVDEADQTVVTAALALRITHITTGSALSA
ncbi:MAG: hypothetical protein RL375_2438 [Pseudomonadota bacterium]|jgi:hypothetical protein